MKKTWKHLRLLKRIKPVLAFLVFSIFPPLVNAQGGTGEGLNFGYIREQMESNGEFRVQFYSKIPQLSKRLNANGVVTVNGQNYPSNAADLPLPDSPSELTVSQKDFLSSDFYPGSTLGDPAQNVGGVPLMTHFRIPYDLNEQQINNDYFSTINEDPVLRAYEYAHNIATLATGQWAADDSLALVLDHLWKNPKDTGLIPDLPALLDPSGIPQLNHVTQYILNKSYNAIDVASNRLTNVGKVEAYVVTPTSFSSPTHLVPSIILSYDEPATSGTFGSLMNLRLQIVQTETGATQSFNLPNVDIAEPFSSQPSFSGSITLPQDYYVEIGLPEVAEFINDGTYTINLSCVRSGSRVDLVEYQVQVDRGVESFVIPNTSVFDISRMSNEVNQVHLQAGHHSYAWKVTEFTNDGDGAVGQEWHSTGTDVFAGKPINESSVYLIVGTTDIEDNLLTFFDYFLPLRFSAAIRFKDGHPYTKHVQTIGIGQIHDFYRFEDTFVNPFTGHQEVFEYSTQVPYNNPPEGTITSPIDGTLVSLGKPVTFSANGDDPNGDSANIVYNWIIDGVPYTGKSVSHTFSTEGPVAVSLTVVDEVGLADPTPAEINITVCVYNDVSGVITADTRWTASGSPYRLTGNLYIRNSSTLTIDPGVIVEQGGYYIMAGDSQGYLASSRGHLVANGVTFQGNRNGLIYSYMHPNGTNDMTSVTLTDCTLESSHPAGLGVACYYATLTLDGCTIQGNNSSVIGVSNSSGTMSINDSVISGFTLPVRWVLDENDSVLLTGSNNFSGCIEDKIGIEGTSRSSRTLRGGDIQNRIYKLTDLLFVRNSSTMTIDSSVGTLELGGYYIMAGDSQGYLASSRGHLVANGVTFQGNLNGLIYSYMHPNGTNDMTSVTLTDCTLESSHPAGLGVACYYATLTLDGCTIQGNNSSAVGVSNRSGTVSIQYSVIKQFSTAVKVEDGTNLTSINNCDLSLGTTYGIQNVGATVVDARNCYWGHTSGPSDTKSLPSIPNYNNPSGSGVGVSAYVDYQPWLSSNDVLPNMAPVIISVPPNEALEGTFFSYTVLVNDRNDANDGTELTWSLVNAPPGMTISSIGVITWTPPEGTTASGTVTITVADGGEDGAQPAIQEMTLSVVALNNAPQITSNAPSTATEDVEFSYIVIVEDPDDLNNGSDLVWALTNAPPGMTISNTGVITWTPTEGVTTSGTVTIGVSDGGEDGAQPDIQEMILTVTAVNDSPVIASTAPGVSGGQTSYIYDVAVIDPDDANNGADLIWSLSNAPAGMNISSTGQITWTIPDGQTGSVGPITITCLDGGEDNSVPATESFTLDFGGGSNLSPVVDLSTTSTTGTVDSNCILSGSGSYDPDNRPNGYLQYTWTQINGPETVTLSATDIRDVFFVPTVTGDFIFELTVSDGLASTSAQITVTVSEQITYTITVISGVGGSVSSNTTSVPAGADKTFNFTPEPGYRIADVLVDGVSQGPISTYTFEAVSADHTLEVQFILQGAPISDINLPAGISLFGYTGATPIDAKLACQSLIDNEQLSVIRWVDPADSQIKELFYTTFPSPGWVNEIGNLTLGQGYVIKTTDACTLSISGIKSTGSVSYNLPSGYSIIGFNREIPVDAQIAFQSLIDAGSLELVRWVDTSNGQIKELYYTLFPNPGWVNEIGDLTEGQGYIIKLNAAESDFSLP